MLTFLVIKRYPTYLSIVDAPSETLHNLEARALGKLRKISGQNHSGFEKTVQDLEFAPKELQDILIGIFYQLGNLSDFYQLRKEGDLPFEPSCC